MNFLIWINFFMASCETDLRLGTELCDKENDFRKARKQKVFHFMRELLQKHKKDGRPRTADEVSCFSL